ncbi:MAG TPA: fatty acid metabolism transcriptional regulator FadR [Actinobacteria bacterium]|nr:fatty acid metabolism regulator protein [bacterium BMS3Bbin01]HDH25358.1 fatty acid metabolism transcriptional regulator FadR [Actinomycetota bacterium]
MTATWIAPVRPADHAEHSLVEAVLDGTFPPGSELPGERQLAIRLGVTRPTLREALQRLERDGWVTVRQGRRTVVNHFWQEGGLNVLGALVEHSRHLSTDFVEHLLEIRLYLAPPYIAAAVACVPDEVAALVARHRDLPDRAEAFATFDWDVHRRLSIASGNPIFTLILNGFAGFYERLASIYFALSEARDRSRRFYSDLETAARANDRDAAERVSREVMEDSIELWRSAGSATLTVP